jgi:hypothetical protein
MRTYHLIPGPGLWKLTERNQEVILAVYRNKELALTLSTMALRGKTCRLKIHTRDGTVERERTFQPFQNGMGNHLPNGR